MIMLCSDGHCGNVVRRMSDHTKKVDIDAHAEASPFYPIRLLPCIGQKPRCQWTVFIP